MEGHVTIYGEIIAWQDGEADKYGSINLKAVMEEISSQPKATEFIMHIHSVGGDVDEAFAIYDALKASGKKLTASIEGMCASSATIIALAAEERKMTENSQFMIHMPIGGKFGTSEDLQQAADTLKAYEDKIMNLYMSATGSEKDAIYAMMKEETWLTGEQAVSLGFITEMIPTMKAVATINSKHKTMSQLTEKEIDKKFDTWFQKIMKGFKKVDVQMITVTTADGTILDFGEAITEEGQIAVGVTATVDGSPATGDHVLTDGRTLVFADGAITEIKEAEAGETVDSLKAELATANQKIADLEAAKNTAEGKVADTEKAVTKMQEEFKTFKATMKSDLGLSSEGERKTEGEEEKSRKLWKEKE